MTEKLTQTPSRESKILALRTGRPEDGGRAMGEAGGLLFQPRSVSGIEHGLGDGFLQSPQILAVQIVYNGNAGGFVFLGPLPFPILRMTIRKREIEPLTVAVGGG